MARRLTFLPSLTPYSLWEIGHNVVHHGYTNLKGFDFVWAPYSLEEYRALPRWRRALERVYRTGLGPGLYYLIEIWWLKLFFPSKRQMPSRRAIFTGTACWWPPSARHGSARCWPRRGHRPVGTDAADDGLRRALLVWNATVGFVLYVHHTHASVAWYETKAMWTRAQPFVSTTVHLRFRYGIGAALHHIMEHTAHHVDMSVPLYHLKRAQAVLEHALPGRIIVQNFSGAGTSTPHAAASCMTSRRCAGPTSAAARPARTRPFPSEATGTRRAGTRRPWRRHDRAPHRGRRRWTCPPRQRYNPHFHWE